MSFKAIRELPDSDTVFRDTVFMESNKHVSEQWVRISELYPDGCGEALLPETLSCGQFGQGNHYECFMLSALATLVRFPDIIRNCFVSKSARRDGRYTFQFFRGKEWVKVEIDDYIALEEDEVLFIRSPTGHWWPLLLEKAYAKFYTSYDNLEGCTLQETYHDLTGNPVLNIPMDAKLAKVAGADVTEGHYWIDLGQKLQSGQFVGSMLTKDSELESMGLQNDQQYGILEIFSLTGTSSVSDIVIRLYNPFEDEEFIYKGPLNSKDTEWTPKLREKHNVDDERSIFLPLHVALKVVNSMQLCYASPIDGDATYFEDEWKGESAGGNPTSVTWRKNPLYCVRNTGLSPVELVAMVKQEDQRRYTSSEERAVYLQCGIVVVQNVSPALIETYFVTGNNHKSVCKSLFLNSREVTSPITIPPNSLCYLVPSCMKKGCGGSFTLALYRIKHQDYSSLLLRKLSLPDMDWTHSAYQRAMLEMKKRVRVDFYVDVPTEVHILMHQEKAYVSKNGGDVMTQDYVGVYLYDDTDRKIGGVHAATNFRETSVLHQLPRSGRYAISVTCPRGVGEVPVLLTIVGSAESDLRIVEAPEDASMFDDEDNIAEGDDDAVVGNPIDYVPVVCSEQMFVEPADSATPFEDKRFMMDNRSLTNEPWIHIGDLYPDGKAAPLLPDVLERGQFLQGEHFECCCLTAFAALVEHHPDVIRDAFVTRTVRRDGRYTFRFHRYGQWVKVDIDDRIPLLGGKTLFCRSPTGHWWPLLLEKAYAKFYTLYQNVEDCALREVLYDFTGLPVLSIPMDLKLAEAILCDVDDANFWLDLNADLEKCACAAVVRPGVDDGLGLSEGQEYAVLGVVKVRNSEPLTLSDLAVKLHNPFVEAEYTGPMNRGDPAWSPELRAALCPEQPDTIYVPVDVFRESFLSVEKVLINGVVAPGFHFNSEWGEGTNGGNPTLVTWRENPIYVVRNTADTPLQIVAMVGQPDQRHVLHLLPQQEMNYVQCGMTLSQSTSSKPLPTYLVTSNNHRVVHKGLFINYRELANIITIPAGSLSYLVPSAMYHDKTKFILSYWYEKAGDMKSIKVDRLSISVARGLPAIEHLELHNREKKRVDFLVDFPTDVHILLRQQKSVSTSGVGDAMAEDFLGIYLYDGDERRMNGVTAATNYREMGIVHQLPSAGRYALSVTCPRGSGAVPCKVEIVGVEEAHVRITDAPEDAGNLCEVDLRFLDVEPEGVPLEDLPLDSDEKLQELLEYLKVLHEDFDGNEAPIAEYEALMNERVHAMAKQVLARDRPKYLPGHDLELLNPVLDAEPDFVDLERSRYRLKSDPRNATKVRGVEKKLLLLAGELMKHQKDPDLGFLGAEVEGIPVCDMSLLSDASFAKLARERVGMRRDAVANASRVAELESAMRARAKEMAQHMHARERIYLDPEPEGVPLDLLPLNEDETVSTLEDRLRALNRRERRDARQLQGLEDAVSERVRELALELKDRERDMFLEPAPYGFPVDKLPLDEDSTFHELEVERLRLRADGSGDSSAAVRAAEDCLNGRARELARVEVLEGRRFLDQEPLGFPLSSLGLDENGEFVRKEAELWRLKWEPRVDMSAVRAAEGDLARLVDTIALKKAEQDRGYLESEYEGRPVHSLPLNDDKELLALEVRRRHLVAAGAGTEEVRAVEKLVGEAVRWIACVLNARERPEYLDVCPRGVPIEDLPLDSDAEFHGLEVRRQRLKNDPKRNHAAVLDVERALKERADALAKERLCGDRGYLDTMPAGVPLRLVPLDEDRVFQDLEAQRAVLMRNPRRNAKSIRALEDELNERASTLAVELKHRERAKFLDPNPTGIPITDVPIDDDGAFCERETQRLVLCEDPYVNSSAIRRLEDAMNERAMELASRMRGEMRLFLDPTPLGVPLEELPLDDSEEFVAKEGEFYRLRRDPQLSGDAVAAIRAALNDLARQMAAEVLARERAFLYPEPEGRLLRELPLNEDKDFRALEKRLRQLRRAVPPDAQAIAATEELLNDRAHQLARAMNRAERKLYLDPNPGGVALDDVSLDDDNEFLRLEVRRAGLMRDAEGNRAAIEELENAMNARAKELGSELLRMGRTFLLSDPQGVPIACLSLDEDEEFHMKEVERMALKGENLRRNEGRIRELESILNDRANCLARDVKSRVRSNLLDPFPSGVPLSVVPLDEDCQYCELEADYLRALHDGKDTLRIERLADVLRAQCDVIANEVKSNIRLSLEQRPLGFTLDELFLDENSTYLDKERQLLMNCDASCASEDVARCMEELNAIVQDLAKEAAVRERGFLDQEPEGRLICELPLSDDATFLGLERQRRQLRRDPFRDEGRLADLEQMMNDRVHELAKKTNAMDRPNFLVASAHGVPLHDLPLDSDRDFARLEAGRAVLMRDAEGNRAAIEELENAMNARASLMAAEAVRRDRMYLGDEIEGVAVRHLPLDEDPEFRALEVKRAGFKGRGSEIGARAVRDLEEQLRDRAADLARDMKDELRGLLDPRPLGIPLRSLPLDSDERFHALEATYRDLVAEGVGSGKVGEVLLQLGERAREIAQCIHDRERASLEQRPVGMPLTALPLNDDETFNALETEARKLRSVSQNRGRNHNRLVELESAMNERAVELANQLRRTYCDSAPEGIPLELLGLGDVDVFRKLEERLRDLRRDPEANREAISDVELDLNDKAHEVARSMLEGDRGYLDPEPAGVPLCVLPLSTDSDFRALEAERAVLKAKDPHRCARKIRELENRLGERAHALAEEQKMEDLSGLDAEPEGVPLRLLKLHDDPTFSEMVGLMRELKRDPKRNGEAIEELRERMNDLAHGLARERLTADRAFLDRCPEGVPVADLPLDTDPLFHKMESERARLKERDSVRNATKIRDLECRLNDRAAELARDQKEWDLSVLDPLPCGVPIEILGLHEDPVFVEMLGRMREMRKAGRSGDALAGLVSEMNEYARRVAEERLVGDRGYLEPDPLGVPLGLLPLLTDATFHRLEVERAVQKAEGTRHKAAKIAKLEAQLNERAQQLASAQQQWELDGVDPEPEGIPLCALDLRGDAEFAKLVDEVRGLRGACGVDDRVHAAKELMNEIAHGLARRVKECDREYLDKEPEGVPLSVLPLDSDRVFSRLEAERATLKAQGPQLHARRILELEATLNNRASELAREQLREDVVGVDEAPCGIPLELLRLHSDGGFAAMVNDLRMLKKRPDANRESIEEVVGSMNERAHEVAAAQFDRGFLETAPEGVPLAVLPLDTDRCFRDLEVERVKLKLEDARRNARRIKALEEELDDRARELALEQLREDLSGVDKAPEGIPLELLKVNEDGVFAAMISELRELKKNRTGNVERIRELEDMMNNRAYEIADGLLEGDRTYLEQAPHGVPLSELPLCSDEQFAAMEVERAKLKAQDPRRNAGKVAELEARLNRRAGELAEEQLLLDLESFPREYEGISITHLKPHEDKEFASLVPELRRLKREGESPAVQAHVAEMDRRLREVAKELLCGDLWFLDKEPEGVPIAYLALDEDHNFGVLRRERARLKAEDPRGNAVRIQELEGAMNERAHELANILVDDDFDGVEREPYGLPLVLLSPRDDAIVSRIIAMSRMLKHDSSLNAPQGKLNELKEQLNYRIHELAAEALAKDRLMYLDDHPEGVDLSILSLDGDTQFRALELERAICRLQNCEVNSKRLVDIERLLNYRAHELAKRQLQEDMYSLEKFPYGLPIEILNPHNDEKFSAMVACLRELKKDTVSNKKKIEDMTCEMNEYARSLALNLLHGDRNFLNKQPEGVFLDELQLDGDKKFHALEVERAILKRTDSPNAEAVTALENSLNERAHELAREQLEEDLRGLNGFPRGVPLKLLRPHGDPRFAELVADLRQLKKNGDRKAGGVLRIEAQLDARADEMAEEFLRVDRGSYLKPEPLGVALELLPLDNDPEFSALEADRLRVLLDRNGNKNAIEEFEEALNGCVFELVGKLLRANRGFLNEDPLGIPLGILPLDNDRQFHELEVKRFMLKTKDPVRNGTSINVLEDQLNDRALVLAEGQITDDLNDVDPAPKNIPLRLLRPHDDLAFRGLIERSRALKLQPALNPAELDALLCDMNLRAKQLAEDSILCCRGKLDAFPEGIPLSALPLDSDALFRQMEQELVTLTLENERKNAARAADLELRLNERAGAIAYEVKLKDIEQLDQLPCGIPIGLLKPHKDPVFASLANDARGSRKTDGELFPPEVVDALNGRVIEIVMDVINKDQNYLNREPYGIPIAALRIEEDPGFRALQAERAKLLLTDPKHNADKISDLEHQLNLYATMRGKEFLVNDRGFLDLAPEGVPNIELDLDEDPLFHRMDVERAKLKIRDPVSNAYRIGDLEDKLNERAHELAKGLLDNELQAIEAEPEGVPLTFLRPCDDTEFSSLIIESSRLKKDPKRNATKIKELRERMSDHVYRLAREALANLRKQLDQEPEGIPLDLLPLDTDKSFKGMERELLALLAAPHRNEGNISNLRERMNGRCRELARDKMEGDCEFLDPQPEGIYLADLPLCLNEVFRSRISDRAKLKKLAPSGDEAIATLEAELNTLVHTIAKEVKLSNRAFLNSFSHGIPKELLPLDDDRNFTTMESRLRRLKCDGHRSASAVQKLEGMLQDRADDLALRILTGDRGTYLFFPEGMDAVDVPVDMDEEFSNLELQRAIVKLKAPAGWETDVKRLEDRLNGRLLELINERVKADRDFIEPDPEGIPLKDIPFDSDAEFKKLESQRRKLRRVSRRRAVDVTDLEDAMNDRIRVLARLILQDDLSLLQPEYRRIPTADLNLHNDAVFRELANRRRSAKREGDDAGRVAALEKEMDGRAQLVANDVITKDRAFLPPQPEGMYLSDLPLDIDDTFVALEGERRRRLKDPRIARRNKNVVSDIEANMSERSYELAREAFSKMRSFMDQEPEGLSLRELPLDADPIFKEAEVARYMLMRNPDHRLEDLLALENAMNQRAYEIAKDVVTKDRGFLDPEPEGVPLAELPLDTDDDFKELAQRRFQLKRKNKSSRSTDVRMLEEKMNDRVHELAREYLESCRTFLDREPEGVPLSDIPFGRDCTFTELERELLLQQKSSVGLDDRVINLQKALNNRVHELAKTLLQKERVFLDPEPLGVPLMYLPLNHDPVMNSLERRRRALRKASKHDVDTLQQYEDEIQECVNRMAKELLAKERAFLNPTPRGISLEFLPLNEDRQLRDMENELRELRKYPTKNKKDIDALEYKMNSRVDELARDYLHNARSFLTQEPLGVPLEELPLETDEFFHETEKKYHQMKKGFATAGELRDAQERMNNRVMELAAECLKKERAFLDQNPEGIPLSDLYLSNDKNFCEMERNLRALRKQPRRNAEAIKNLEFEMNEKAHAIARRKLSDDRGYLPLELYGVPVYEVPLDSDSEFRELEVCRHNLKKNSPDSADDIDQIEEKLTARALAIAEEFVWRERAYLDPAPAGIPLQRLPLNTDELFRELELRRRQLNKEKKNNNLVLELEHQLKARTYELANALVGWQDVEFHEANKHLAQEWPRICELYPEGKSKAVMSDSTRPDEVASAPGELAYLAPFIAALSQHPPLLHRLLETRSHPGNGRYTFIFFDPNSNPVRVDIDDRVPVDARYEPKYTRVPQRSWYPLLLEKAYAKFVGGYAKLEQCTPHETLRDLTGRPVLHIPFDERLADAANIGDFRSVVFWRGIIKNLSAGDVITCITNDDVPDGLHPLCSYALLSVIETVPESSDPADIVVKLHNCYYDEPRYEGPLSSGDARWTDNLKRVCRYSSDEEALFLPLPVFLRNFSSMQRCHINCGDRLTAPGEWSGVSCGGNPKFTSFRNNPIFLVENKSSRAATILAELRHHSPTYTDLDGVNHYHQTGLALLKAINSKMPVSPLITCVTHRFLQKGMMLDAREVCAQMEIPPNTTCYLVPYTLTRENCGKFHMSIYPGITKVSLSPLRGGFLHRNPVELDVDLPIGVPDGCRVEFVVDVPCDVHLLLRQSRVCSSEAGKSDAIGEEDVMMVSYNENGARLASTGIANNCVEQALVFRVPQEGRYSVGLLRVGVSKLPLYRCRLLMYTPRNATAAFVPISSDAKPSRLTKPRRFSHAASKVPGSCGGAEGVGSSKHKGQCGGLPPVHGAPRISSKKK